MSNITRAERLACVPIHKRCLRWQSEATAELLRLAESERALLEALELAAEYVDDYCAERKKALGHVPPWDERALRVLGGLIAKTKEARQ